MSSDSEDSTSPPPLLNEADQVHTPTTTGTRHEKADEPAVHEATAALTAAGVSDRIGDKAKALAELRERRRQAMEDRTEDEKHIYKFDDGDQVDYRLPPDTSFADELPADADGLKPITWTQLKKKFCFERPANGFVLYGEISAKDMTHWERSKSVKVRDCDGVEGVLFFYEEDTHKRFDWSDVVIGSAIEILHPRYHRFMDEQEGMRVEDNLSIRCVRKQVVTDAMRLGYGKQGKENGNRYFNLGKYEQALSCYDQAVTHVEGTFKESPELQEEAQQVAAMCYLNIAAVRIGEKKWELVEYPCERALVLNVSPALNAKAYFRLGQAAMSLHQVPNAIAKLTKAAQLAPEDSKVADLLRVALARQAEERAADRQVFQEARRKKELSRGLFGFRPPLLAEEPTSLASVRNFRDIASMGITFPKPNFDDSFSSTLVTIRKHWLFRSSTIMDADRSDLSLIRDVFGVKTILDLRNVREARAYRKILVENNAKLRREEEEALLARARKQTELGALPTDDSDNDDGNAKPKKKSVESLPDYHEDFLPITVSVHAPFKTASSPVNGDKQVVVDDVITRGKLSALGWDLTRAARAKLQTQWNSLRQQLPNSIVIRLQNPNKEKVKAAAETELLRRNFRASEEADREEAVLSPKSRSDLPFPSPNSEEERLVLTRGCRVSLNVDLGTRSMLSLLPWYCIVVAFVLGALQLTRLASRVVVQNTAQRVGPLRVYLNILRKQSPELRYIFDVLLPQKEHYPLIVCCSLGKDRTGVVIALLLSLLGVPDETIAEEYNKTESCISEHHRALNAELGLSEEWSQCPKSLMLSFLEETNTLYGGAVKYLLGIGVRRESLERIREILLKPVRN